MNKFLDLIIVIYDYARWSLMYLNLKTGKKIKGGMGYNFATIG